MCSLHTSLHCVTSAAGRAELAELTRLFVVYDDRRESTRVPSAGARPDAAGAPPTSTVTANDPLDATLGRLSRKVCGEQQVVRHWQSGVAKIYFRDVRPGQPCVPCLPASIPDVLTMMPALTTPHSPLEFRSKKERLFLCPNGFRGYGIGLGPWIARPLGAAEP